MHLRSLELFGFKSFADKTLFDFHKGVTAIVGPNGCGKSNVLDAVRWVLGEQSAKSLRGGEMADVIFNGTDSRKPLGFAEVSVTFSECEHELGVDWNEVRVTRRVYRDGNSEYLLNNTVCRLRDIQGLFADTGVARAAYSMMEQGKIDMILSSRPEDRRAVFEEAAGITKYKAQKREALRKLEATEANLLRIGDVIKEVKRQIGSLQRQAGKARRYQALHADLRVLDLHHSKKQLAALEAQLAECRKEIEHVGESEQETRREIDNGENELAEKRHGLDKIDIAIGDSRAATQQLQSEIAANRSRIEFNRQRAAELQELINRARDDIAAAEARQREHAAQAEQLTTQINKGAEVLGAKETELAQAVDALGAIRARREARQARRAGARDSLGKIEARIATLSDELAGVTARRELTLQQIEQIAAELGAARDTHKHRENEIATARRQTESEQQELAQLSAAATAAEKNVRRHEELLARAEEDLAAVDRTIAEKNSALEVLRQLNEVGEGLKQGSQAVLKGIDQPERFRDAVVGPLVAQLDVERKFVAAIEAALGRNLHTIVLKDGAPAADMIARLTRKKFGQAALFLPRIGVSANESVRKTLPAGAIAWAVDKVSAPRALEPLLRHLLAGVAIFPDLERALACKQHEPTLAMATLDGEFVSAAGIVFGGSNGARHDSLLERKTRISALAAEQNALAGERELVVERREELKRLVAEASDKLEQARTAEQAARLAQSTAHARIALLEGELHATERKIDELTTEKRRLEEQTTHAAERVAQLETEVATLRNELVREQTDAASAEREEVDARTEEESTRERIADLKLAVATEQQRHAGLAAQRDALRARENELAELITTRGEDIRNYEQKLVTQADESRAAEAAIAEQGTRVIESERAAAALNEQRVAQARAVEQHELALRRWRESLSGVQEERARNQVRESQLQMQIEHLTERLERRYHVDVRGFASDSAVFEKVLRAQLKKRDDPDATPRADVDLAKVSDEQLAKLVDELSQQLENMGPVNLEAVQEYDELEERYKFLEAQNTDLTNSRRELLDVIARINATTKQMFAETFAQVRANFREMFAELFGGGRADLSLMDEADPLNCGIEISAKPPGKQLQTISLLSGGERSMVAVALLFAIYMVRPSPFCVLDEIDAPLDETNINRFLSILQRFVGQSQFVIITHNKRTIAKADILYGVTMEERGVSKLVTMRLTAPAPIESRTSSTEPITQRQFALAENGHSARESVAAR